MNRIAEFEKVSFEQFKKDVNKLVPEFDEESIRYYYDRIQLPTRATKGSAGYDFKTPYGFDIMSGKPRIIPTGIRCKIKDGWVLQIYPRSGLGFKHGVALYNTVGVIDSDYYYSDNEGHIMLKLRAEKPVVFEPGDGIAQGILMVYGITINDRTDTERNGGFGSTGR